jgi:hypothetical protein
VVFNRKRNGYQSERLVIFFIFSFLIFPVFSQDDKEDLDVNVPLVVEISPDKIIVGQRFDLTIFADFSAYRDVTIIEPELPEGITLVSGPYKSAQTIRVGELDDPRYIKKTRVFYKYIVSQPGLFYIDSYSLTDGDISFKTEPIMFPVLAYDERHLKYPVFARWKKIPEQIFVGETIPLILEMENLEELSFPEKISIEAPTGGVFEEVNSVGEISVTAIGDDEVYIAPIESWLYTPTSVGKVTIPSATVQYGNISRSTGSKYLEILKSPLEIESTGAIGNFKVSTYIDNLPLRKGSISNLHIKVEGEGNLNYLQMPKPVFSGLTIIEKEELYHIIPSYAGYSGSREDIYRITTGDAAELVIFFEDWKWFNKELRNIETVELSDYRYKNNSLSDQDSQLSFRDRFQLLSVEKIMKYKDSVYNVSWYYLLILPGFLSIVTALIKRKHDMRLLGISLILILFSSSAINSDEELKAQLERVAIVVGNGVLDRALDIYDDILFNFGENPGVLYNKAILNYDVDHKEQVILNLRKALILKPGDRIFNNTLTFIEEEYGLDHQVRATTGLSPDLFFVIFILLFNLGAMAVVFNINKRKIELSIVILLIFFLASLTILVIFYTDHVSKRETAVVIDMGGELKKVPGDLGGDWLTLQAGTAVYISSESNDSFLIQTGYGLEGWLDKSLLLNVQGDRK